GTPSPSATSAADRRRSRSARPISDRCGCARSTSARFASRGRSSSTTRPASRQSGKRAASSASIATDSSSRSRRPRLPSGAGRAVDTRTLAEDELAAALKILRKRSSAELAAEHGLDPERARTLAAGAVILSEMQRRLIVPLVVGRGGVREGALLELAAQQTAA